MQTCAIIEADEKTERTLREYIRHISFLELIWTCNTIDQALVLVKDHHVDLLFLSLSSHTPLQAGHGLYDLVEHCKHIIGVSLVPKNSLPVKLPLLAYLQKPLVFDQFLEAIELFAAE